MRSSKRNGHHELIMARDFRETVIYLIQHGLQVEVLG